MRKLQILYFSKKNKEIKKLKKMAKKVARNPHLYILLKINLGGRRLEICHLFVDSIVFKQYIHGSFLPMEGWWVIKLFNFAYKQFMRIEGVVRS